MPGEVAANGHRVRELREAAGLSQRDLGKRAHVTQTAISKIESGIEPMARLSTLARLAEVFGVELVELLARPAKATKTEMREVPLVGVVPGGKPQYNDQLPSDTVDVEAAAIVNVRRPYALRVSGSSMNPTILDGDIIVYDPDYLWAVGHVVVALVGNETTVKRVAKGETGLVLVSDNPDGPKIDPHGQDVTVLGKVVWRQSGNTV
jgi:SOS-response transcriptional repressor LexA